MTPTSWTDTHCHLSVEEGDALVRAARSAGVSRMIDVGTNLDHSRQAIERATEFTGVWATVGVHPHDAVDGVDGLVELLDAPEVVAVGECGLDFHYDNSPRDEQKRVFAEQIQMAHEFKLPLVIHTRSAWAETFDILDGESMPERTIFHCFTGGPGEAQSALDRGAHLSFSGIVTFKNAPEVREAAALCPSDRYLVETDAPYLAPAPNRGRRNEPAWVTLVGAGVAVARDCSVEDVASQTWANATEVFGLGDGGF